MRKGDARISLRAAGSRAIGDKNGYPRSVYYISLVLDISPLGSGANQETPPTRSTRQTRRYDPRRYTPSRRYRLCIIENMLQSTIASSWLAGLH